MRAAVLVGRVGGLAAALGAGVVIGLTTAAPATAQPADSGSATRSDTAESSTRPASTARRGAGTIDDRRARAARSSASITAAPGLASASADAPDVEQSSPHAARGARVTENQPAAPTAAPVLAATVQAPRRDAEQPVAVSASAAVPPASVTVASVPAASASPAPAINFLQSLLGCDPRGRLITIFKGTHFAIPNSFSYFTKQVTGTGTFTTNTAYDLKDEDQFDWNKFTGIAFTPLEPDRNSVMVGWRYNLASQEFEIAPFYNVDKKRILPNEQTEVISVPAGETFDYFVDYTGVRISYGGKTVYKPYPEGLKPNVWTAARVSGWFGGNEVAPRTISYYLKLAR